ncbi:MAG: 50S ribosomal protein L9 [Elusimicrobiota bacterium]|nr:50S ribosomal protein L9 [Endomicrobiia bacterium]MCX7911084.1 50S ribosomal protein L9 [Endomicrobiia bacterium]MDW8166278.1 50S ribosomal protein L9 [Elusimicrobiota bacterium]
MKVILLQEIKNLGSFGDIKEVKDGYARNFLLPKKMALVYNEKNLKYIENLKKNLEIKRQREIDFINEIKDKLEKSSITITVNVGKDNKVYGAVTKERIADAIEQNLGIKIDKHNIKLQHPIKEVGIFYIEVHLSSKKFSDISQTAKLKIWIVGREEKNK